MSNPRRSFRPPLLRGFPEGYQVLNRLNAGALLWCCCIVSFEEESVQHPQHRSENDEPQGMYTYR